MSNRTILINNYLNLIEENNSNITQLITMMNKLDLKVLKLKKIVEPSTKYTLFCFAQKIK